MISIRFTKSGVVGIKRRQLQRVGREAMREPAKLWIKRYLPLHFKRTALYRYKYLPRADKYRKRKLAKGEMEGRKAIGEDLPLVWSGSARTSAIKNNRVEVFAKNYQTYRADIIMPAPSLNFIPRLREELTRVTKQETLQMEKEFAKAFEYQLNLRGRTQESKTY